MRTNLPIRLAFVASLCIPHLSSAQSPHTSNVVSIRELSIPSKARDAFRLGCDLLRKSQAAESLPYFQHAVTLFPSYVMAYYDIGVADVRLSRITDAEWAFRKSIEVSAGQNATPLFGLGGVLDIQGKFDEAEEVTRRGLYLEPTAWNGHYYLGLALYNLNRLEEAEKSVRESLRRKTNSPMVLGLLANIHCREQNYHACFDDLNTYLRLDPDSSKGVEVRAIRDIVQRFLARIPVSENSGALAAPQP